MEYHITQYDLEQGALEIQYIEDFFGEFPRKKTAVEIVRMCDGVKSVRAIVDELATKYNADRALITVDVLAMLQDLADKSFLEDKGVKP